jgi:hypothetical protein
MAAHLMFAPPLLIFPLRVRTGPSQGFAEAVAAFASVQAVRPWVERRQPTSRSDSECGAASVAALSTVP